MGAVFQKRHVGHASFLKRVNRQPLLGIQTSLVVPHDSESLVTSPILPALPLRPLSPIISNIGAVTVDTILTRGLPRDLWTVRPRAPHGRREGDSW